MAWYYGGNIFGTYEYMKNALKKKKIWLKQGFQSGFLNFAKSFQIWPSFGVHEKKFGLPKVSGPFGILKEGARSLKV